MLTAHHWLAFGVIGVAAIAAVWGGTTYLRRTEPGPTLGHLLALVQTLLVAQVGLGLLLLGDGRRAPDDLHYVYGTLALLVVLAPWFYAPVRSAAPPRVVRRHVARRGRARGPGLDDLGLMKRFWSDMNPTLRGFLIIALIALTVVVLNLYAALASLQFLAQIAFFLAIAFFLYLVWRERRSDIAVWPTHARIAFYGAIVLIVVDIGAYILVGASGLAAVAFLLVIAISGFAAFRAWRDQRTYGY